MKGFMNSIKIQNGSSFIRKGIVSSSFIQLRVAAIQKNNHFP